MNENAIDQETTTRGAAPDPGHLSCTPKKYGAKKGAPVKIPAAFSSGLGTALKLAPQGRVHHYQNGASDSHRGFTLRPCHPPGIFKGDGIQTEVKQSGTTDYTFDVRGRLVGISGYNADCSVLTAVFKYDALGRRVEKTVNGVTTKYVYDGLDIVQEMQNGTVSANYIRTMNIDEPLARFTPNSSRFYKQDALGSVVQLTDETGVVRTTYTYDPFGNTTVSGEVSDNPFQYTGRENDNTGLYYYRARYYNPELQRFISEDPIGLAGGDVNFYAYVGNSPVNAVDPLGLIYVIYEQGLNRISVFSNEMEFYAQYEARNSVTRDSNGQFPAGEYSFGAPRGPRGTTNRTTGNWFNPILNVPGRQDMGLHGGGSCAGSRAFEDRQQWCSTFGCIRMQNEDVEIIAGLIAWKRRNNRSSKILILPAYPTSGFGR